MTVRPRVAKPPDLMERLNVEEIKLRGRTLVASTVADAEQAAALRHRAALGQLVDRAAAGRAGDDDAGRLRNMSGPIALLPTGQRGECRLVDVGEPISC